MQKIITSIVKKLAKHYQPEKIILYGSWAYGKPDAESDIDLLIIKDTEDRPIDRRIQVRRLVNLKKPIAFSPLVLAPQELDYLIQNGDDFIGEILTKGKVLYAR